MKQVLKHSVFEIRKLRLKEKGTCQCEKLLQCTQNWDSSPGTFPSRNHTIIFLNSLTIKILSKVRGSHPGSLTWLEVFVRCQTISISGLVKTTGLFSPSLELLFFCFYCCFKEAGLVQIIFQFQFQLWLKNCTSASAQTTLNFNSGAFIHSLIYSTNIYEQLLHIRQWGQAFIQAKSLLSCSLCSVVQTTISKHVLQHSRPDSAVEKMEEGKGDSKRGPQGTGKLQRFKRMARESFFNTVKFEQRHKRNGNPKCHMGQRERTARTKAQMAGSSLEFFLTIREPVGQS